MMTLPIGITQQAAGGAAAPYDPGMMTFSGGYYSDTTPNWSGNKLTQVLRFNISSFTGGGYQHLVLGRASRQRIAVIAWSSDYADANYADRVYVSSRDTANTLVCALVSPTGYLDGQDHTLFYSFDADSGTAVYRIDLDDADDVGNANRTAPTTGVLPTVVATVTFNVGSDQVGTNVLAGKLGFFGISNTYRTNYSDFMSATGPKELDESGWTEWGAQPLFWNQYGTMTDNKGSAGNMTANGTITGPA